MKSFRGVRGRGRAPSERGLVQLLSGLAVQIAHMDHKPPLTIALAGGAQDLLAPGRAIEQC